MKADDSSRLHVGTSRSLRVRESKGFSGDLAVFILVKYPEDVELYGTEAICRFFGRNNEKDCEP